MKYSIVDIETNGGDKITEISILVFDGEKIIDEFTSLVNPESNIPSFITNLTGITQPMVANAPKFYEVAKKVYEITKDTVFVAHNVNFDYGIIGKEFKSLGSSFKRKKLCTVRLSRKLLPNKKSYSLGNLCASEGIKINDRHRAKGDADATVILFKKLLILDEAQEESVISTFLNPRSRQATLPPLLSKTVFDNLSEKTGVYYFKNEAKDIIYVGKANNIKQRVLSHFYDKKKKEITMCMATADITYTETGSELLALLLESSEIKKHYPKYNRAQRRTAESIGLFCYEDRLGVIHLAWNKLKLAPNPITKFYTVSEARSFVEKLCEKFELCPKYCHLQTNVSGCFHYQLKKCRGVCRQEETIKSYNSRVQQALDSIKYKEDNFIIKQPGLKDDQYGFVLVLNGFYKGFGYLDTKKEASLNEYMNSITSLKDTRDVQRILNSHLKNYPENLMLIEESTL
ncbi:DNA polymerase-3 subunit epsilon [Tenacibaculum sp. MAR_2009_124]|uniref:exonuclease domain-containing protein n=1 Tax=Tenacibaculum sp. MAR_2009_124 TaxID=1250059 RepID=UPI0008983016|nr:exonuclease domain-containing protein [Tenacibaculum sp. MAR_2009_124]SEB47593.1 DNA polymerase-3 subunit epsilon [Tenacibaculum sp. MAR_2009_124]